MKNNKLLLAVFLSTSGSTAFAAVPNAVVTMTQTIPAISQAGLIALAFVVGMIGARLISRAKNTRI